MKNMLIQPVKKLSIKGRGRDKRVGVLVAIKKNDVVHFGWSRCNRKLHDRFNLNEGTVIALNRALGVEKVDFIPQSLQKPMVWFMKEAAKHFRFTRVYTHRNINMVTKTK